MYYKTDTAELLRERDALANDIRISRAEIADLRICVQDLARVVADLADPNDDVCDTHHPDPAARPEMSDDEYLQSIADGMITIAANCSPRYEHDCCTSCAFVGRMGRYDLYYHHDHNEPFNCTPIARYGSGGDYASGLPLSNGAHIPLTVARALWEAGQ